MTRKKRIALAHARQELSATRHSAARVIQSYFRRYVQTFIEAARLIQLHFREYTHVRYYRPRILEHVEKFETALLPTRKTVQFKGPLEVMRAQLTNLVTCSVCFEQCDVPMSATCCLDAARYNVICFRCMIQFMQIDKAKMVRRASVRSWNPSCRECRFDPRDATIQNSSHIVAPIWSKLSDTIGESHCFACDRPFPTTYALYTHLKEGCEEIVVCCDLCDATGQRHWILGKHFEDTHNRVVCPVCFSSMLKQDYPFHIEYHLRNVLKAEDSKGELALSKDDTRRLQRIFMGE